MPQLLAGVTRRMLIEVSRDMREADRLEAYRASGLGPLAALEKSMEGTTNAFRVEHEGRAVIVGGCSPLPSDPLVGSPWLLGTDFITEHRVWFLRNSRAIWHTVEHQYSYLWNLVDAKNTVHLRWLEWSGCRFIGSRQLNGNPFIEFVKQCVSPSPPSPSA